MSRGLKTVGGLREQDVDAIEGTAMTILSLVQTIRSLENQLEVVDRELTPVLKQGQSRVETIRLLIQGEVPKGDHG